MNIATEGAKYKGIDFGNLLFGSLTRPVKAQLDTWEWLKWPYWNYVLIGTGVFVILLILVWFYANWIR